MSRGRHAQPDAVKALKGNPGKRKLALDNAGKEDSRARPALAAVTAPEFLTHDREKAIFTKIIEDYLQRRIARPVDITAYGRWASYVHRWVGCKEQLDGKATWYKIASNHGERLARHPMFKDMLDLERVLQSLEDRLGLNPAARQNILRGLAAMPAAMGGFFGEEPPHPDEKPASEIPDGDPPTAPPLSPLGYLQNAGKLN